MFLQKKTFIFWRSIAAFFHRGPPECGLGDPQGFHLDVSCHNECRAKVKDYFRTEIKIISTNPGMLGTKNKLEKNNLLKYLYFSLRKWLRNAFLYIFVLFIPWFGGTAEWIIVITILKSIVWVVGGKMKKRLG